MPSITPTDLLNASALGKASNREPPSNTLDKDSFLRLMVAKLQNQDPMNPTDDSEYMSQLAQMTSVEQLQNMALSMQVGVAFDLLGRTVTYADGKTGELIEGTVEKVYLEKGSPVLTIDGVDGIQPAAVTSVR